MAPGRSTRFVYTSPQALTLWLKDGEWHTALSPNPDRLDGADRVYPGGYQARLSDAARAELEAGGFASNVVLQEIR